MSQSQRAVLLIDISNHQICGYSHLCYQAAMIYKLGITALQGGVDRLVKSWPVLPAENSEVVSHLHKSNHLIDHNWSCHIHSICQNTLHWCFLFSCIHIVHKCILHCYCIFLYCSPSGSKHPYPRYLLHLYYIHTVFLYVLHYICKVKTQLKIINLKVIQ